MCQGHHADQTGNPGGKFAGHANTAGIAAVHRCEQGVAAKRKGKSGGLLDLPQVEKDGAEVFQVEPPSHEHQRSQP